MLFNVLTLTLQVDLLKKWTMTFESKGLLIVAIYIWLPPASYVVFLTTLVGPTLNTETASPHKIMIAEWNSEHQDQKLLVSLLDWL